MKKIGIIILALSLSACGANKRGWTRTFIMEGGIYYKPVQGETHNFELHVYENKFKLLDQFGINSMTSDERLWVANDVFTFRPYLTGDAFPICLEEVTVINEERYIAYGWNKSWLNRPWWKLDIVCNDINPNFESECKPNCVSAMI